MWAARFDAFVRRKEDQARAAAIPGFHTVEDRSHAFDDLGAIASPWTRECFDGPFYWTPHPDGRSINLVFVQSRDGNTVADDPAALGGGETDHHLVYEGLSRVHADAVLAGAHTVTGADVFFSVWHPEIVALRASLGRTRHPAQIVVSGSGHLQIDDDLIFNVPDVPVFVITSESGSARCAEAIATRPWVHAIVTGATVDLPQALDRLSLERRIRVVSVVGGRTLATTLVDAGMVDDIYLTTSPLSGGQPHTPFYARGELSCAPVVRKEGRGSESRVRFAHLRPAPPGGAPRSALRKHLRNK
jgi:5-amino-6-(5-phosphoribosylamino)uracil reductase